MNKEFIPYEQALELKELGFNEECFGMYQKNKKIWYCDKNNWITNFEVDPDVETLNLHIKEYPKNVSLINGIHFLHSCANFTAPTFSQCFRFFREKYGLYSWITMELGATLTFCWIVTGENKGTEHKAFFKSYEEAELACLKKLIEIVKNK